MNNQIRKTGIYYISFYSQDNIKLNEEYSENYLSALELGKEYIKQYTHHSFRIDKCLYNSKDKNYKWEYRDDNG